MPTSRDQAATPSREGYVIAAFKPLSRWAVAPEARPDIAGIPFWTRRGAIAELAVLRDAAPHSRPVLLRKRLGRRVEVVDV